MPKKLATAEMACWNHHSVNGVNGILEANPPSHQLGMRCCLATPSEIFSMGAPAGVLDMYPYRWGCAFREAAVANNRRSYSLSMSAADVSSSCSSVSNEFDGGDSILRWRGERGLPSGPPMLG